MNKSAFAFDLQAEVKRADEQWKLAHGTCPTCKGIRFKSCPDCGGEINSFHDHRDYQRPRQVYETVTEWREVNGTPEPKLPDRKLQP